MRLQFPLSDILSFVRSFGRRLHALAVYDARAALVVLLTRDPHVVEGRQRRENLPTAHTEEEPSVSSQWLCRLPSPVLTDPPIQTAYLRSGWATTFTRTPDYDVQRRNEYLRCRLSIVEFSVGTYRCEVRQFLVNALRDAREHRRTCNTQTTSRKHGRCCPAVLHWALVRLRTSGHNDVVEEVAAEVYKPVRHT